LYTAATPSAQGFIQCLERPRLQRGDLYNVWSGHAFSAGIYTMFGAATPSAQGFIRCLERPRLQRPFFYFYFPRVQRGATVIEPFQGSHLPTPTGLNNSSPTPPRGDDRN